MPLLLVLLALCILILPLSVRAEQVSPPAPLITKEGVTVIHPTPYSKVSSGL